MLHSRMSFGVLSAALLCSASGVAMAQQAVAPAPGADAATVGPRQDPERTSLVDDIVVTGTRTPRLRRDSPVRTDVVGQELLTLAAPRNLADALEYLPAARAESNCQNCNTTEIQLLGLPGAYNQILFDGLPLMSGVSAVYGVEQVPAILVERIEVVKGGASALYGPSAVAGVVNVIPRPIGQDGWRAALTHERPDGEAYWAASLMGMRALGGDGAGVTGYLHWEDAPSVDYDGDGYTELAERALLVAGGRARVNLAEKTSLALEYQYTAEDRRGGNRLDQPSFLANISEAIDTRQHRASVTLDHRFTEEAAVTATYAVVQTDRDTFYGGLGEVETEPTAPGFDPVAFDDAVAVSRNQYGVTDNTVHFLELRGETGVGAHALIGGVQYRREDVEDVNIDIDGAVLGTLVQGGFDNLGVFIQDEWSLTDQVRLVLGGRVDFSSELDDPIYSPRLGLWWSPTESLVVRANVSTGFRAPEIFSEDLHIDTLGADPVRVRNAPGLSEERSTSYSLGFDWRPAAADGAFTLDGQAYLTTLEDTLFLGEIETDPMDGSLFQVRSNAGGSTIQGVELTATWRVTDQIRTILGASWVDARYDDDQVVFDDGVTVLVTDRYLKSPRWGVVGQVIWDPNPDTRFFVALRHVDPMLVLNNRLGELVETPSFLVIDASATRHIAVGTSQDVDVTVGVKNVLDERQEDVERGAGRDSDYVYGPRSPRTFYVRFDAHF